MELQQKTTPDQLLHLLGENDYVFPVVRKACLRLGEPQVWMFYTMAKDLNSQGACRKKDGGRRTLGGTWLHLLKSCLSERDAAYIFSKGKKGRKARNKWTQFPQKNAADRL